MAVALAGIKAMLVILTGVLFLGGVVFGALTDAGVCLGSFFKNCTPLFKTVGSTVFSSDAKISQAVAVLSDKEAIAADLAQKPYMRITYEMVKVQIILSLIMISIFVYLIYSLLSRWFKDWNTIPERAAMLFFAIVLLGGIQLVYTNYFEDTLVMPYEGTVKLIKTPGVFGSVLDSAGFDEINIVPMVIARNITGCPLGCSDNQTHCLCNPRYLENFNQIVSGGY